MTPPCGVSGRMIGDSSPALSPVLTGLTLWLEANKNLTLAPATTRVVNYGDQSGLGHDQSQPTEGPNTGALIRIVSIGRASSISVMAFLPVSLDGGSEQSHPQ